MKNALNLRPYNYWEKNQNLIRTIFFKLSFRFKRLSIRNIYLHRQRESHSHGSLGMPFLVISVLASCRTQLNIPYDHTTLETIPIANNATWKIKLRIDFTSVLCELRMKWNYEKRAWSSRTPGLLCLTRIIGISFLDIHRSPESLVHSGLSIL